MSHEHDQSITSEIAQVIFVSPDCWRRGRSISRQPITHPTLTWGEEGAPEGDWDEPIDELFQRINRHHDSFAKSLAETRTTVADPISRRSHHIVAGD